jgi:uncharacterized protein (TIGR02246 family)
MNKKNYFGFAAVCIVFFFTIGCNSTASDAAAKAAPDSTAQKTTQPDMASVKADIQAMETAWANADNARDAKAVTAFYSDDAISMSSNKPMLVGKAAILKDVEAGLAKKMKGTTASYEIMDVFGDANAVTEVGKTIVKDSTGKVTYTGKYMAIWEKRDGKYVCVRDIWNDDVKEK